MKTHRSSKSLFLLLLALWPLAPVLEAQTIIDDPFTDGDRTDGADALDSAWYVASGAGTNSGTINGSGVYAVTNSSGTNLQTWTHFALTSLAVDKKIVVGFDFALSGGSKLDAGTTGPVRIGLYNSLGSQVTADKTAIIADANWSGVPGYAFFANWNSNYPNNSTTQLSLWKERTGANNTLMAGAVHVAPSDATVIVAGADDLILVNNADSFATLLYHAELSLIRRTDKMEFVFKLVDKDTATLLQHMTGSDSTDTYTSFDTFCLFTGSVAAKDFAIDNFKLAVEDAPPNGLISWRTLQGLAADGSQDLLNPSGDGVSNLLKYALNLAPNAGDLALSNNHPLANPDGTTAAELTGLPVLRLNGSSQAEFIYIRRKASTSPGVSYAVHWCDGLESWAPNGIATEATLSLDATWERVTLTDSFTTTQKPKRFAKLVVTTL